MDHAISFLTSAHPWLSYAEAFALVEYAYVKNKSSDKFSGMGSALMRIDIGIFARSSEHDLKNKLAYLSEYGWITESHHQDLKM